MSATNPSTARILRALTTTLATLAALGGVAGVLYLLDSQREPTVSGLTVVAVEPRPDGLEALAADATDQITEAAQRGDELLIVGVADPSPGGDLHISLSCDPQMTGLRCRSEQQESLDRAYAALDRLVTAAPAESVDILQPLRRAESHLSIHPVEGDVRIILNLTGRHDHADGSDILPAQPDTREELVDAAERTGQLPASCVGWEVFVVMADTIDPGYNRARLDLLDALPSRCGGELAALTPRWLADGLSGPTPVQPDLEPESSTATATTTVTESVHHLEGALFETGSADLLPQAQTTIDAVVRTIDYHLAQQHQVQVLVGGCADATGPRTLNQRLSRERATSVAQVVLRDSGIRESDIATVGRGVCTDFEDLSRNRRVDITVTVQEEPS